jgi:tryptophan 7-halogenase
MPDENFKFVIVGGGTAGWLTALYIRKYWPKTDVTVIASSDIGILGAGEGTVPSFIDFLKDVDIPVEDIIQTAKGTVKRGIKFTNWCGKNDQYIHSFEVLGADKYALHFDASLLATHLESVALTRNIKLINDEVVSINAIDDHIHSIDLKSLPTVDADFVFDCSGFRRLIIGEFYQSPWQSYSNTMPAKRAIPFFLPNNNVDLPEYTEAVAMRAGWIWKIPVQHRYGCGYVFDSNKISDEEAKQEIRDYLGHDFVSPKTFNFEAGTYKFPWIGNCLAVGLSAGFVEPLEATSIHMQIITLNLFKQVFGSVLGSYKLNNDLKELNEDILSFLYLHYLTGRNDTEFWSKFSENKMPEKVNNLLSTKSISKFYSSYNFNAWPRESWQSIIQGIRLDLSI